MTLALDDRIPRSGRSLAPWVAFTGRSQVASAARVRRVAGRGGGAEVMVAWSAAGGTGGGVRGSGRFRDMALDDVSVTCSLMPPLPPPSPPSPPSPPPSPSPSGLWMEGDDL